MDPLDLSTLGFVLNPTKLHWQTTSKSTRVLSWNIYGQSEAALRNYAVTAVVRIINPDILLLQETKTAKVVKSIQDEGRHHDRGRKYMAVEAGNEEESQILYDANIYMAINNRK